MITHDIMTLGDLELVLEWATAEGWNPGLDDAQAFLAADPAGFFVAKQGGSPVAAISVVNHSEDFAFLGLYIALRELRGQGVGLGLWHHALAHAGQRTVGLDGVAEQQANYARSGFVAAGETVRFVGAIPEQARADVRDVRAEDVAQLIALEAAASGMAKPGYLSVWLDDTATRKTFVMEEGRRPVGFVTIRRCHSGTKIGPLVARDEAMARNLMAHATAQMPGETMIDVPQTALGLQSLCDDLALTPGFRTARMYRGPVPGPARDFTSVTTLELG